MTPGAARVLFVCTANECRSPFAEALGRSLAGDRPIVFESAGLHSWHRPMPAVGREVAREMGLDIETHVSEVVNPDRLGSYDLIAGMTRSHARELLSLEPGIRSRLFTLKQAARWFGEHPRPARAALGPWLDVVAADRPPTDLLGSDAADDVADPLHEPIARWRAMSGELTTAIDAVLDGIFPARR